MRSQAETLQGETETLKPLRRIHTKTSPAHVSKRLLNIQPNSRKRRKYHSLDIIDDQNISP